VLAVEDAGAHVAAALHQVAVDAREAAIDAFAQADRLDRIHRRGMALRRAPRAVFAEQAFEVVVAIVQRAAQMPAGARGLAAAQVALFEHHHVAPFAGQLVGGGQAGDAGADDADVALRVGGERREPRRVGRAHPQRDAVAVEVGFYGALQGIPSGIRACAQRRQSRVQAA